MVQFFMSLLTMFFGGHAAAGAPTHTHASATTGGFNVTGHSKVHSYMTLGSN
jgi:hypothetical protein